MTDKLKLHHNLAFVKLFKAYPAMAESTKEVTPWQKYIENGLIFLDEFGKLKESVPTRLYYEVARCLGQLSSEFNRTFYRTFNDMHGSTYRTEQMLHYITVALSDLGCNVQTYLPASSVVPPESIPIDYQNYRFVIIREKSLDECFQMFNKYLEKLVAPSSEILTLVYSLLGIAPNINPEKIKSFEVACMYYNMTGTVPTHPVSFLRYLIYQTTSETMIIKNQQLVDRIQNSSYRNETIAYDLFSKASENALASIFLRYKPLFLAFKKHKKCAPIINRLRRKAETLHRPLDPVCIQNLVNVPAIDNKVHTLIKQASNRELVKVLQSVSKAIDSVGYNIYPVRNQKIFVKEITKNKSADIKMELYCICFDELKSRLAHLKNKEFYIPSYIEYATPTSEKQFINTIPYGTKITLPKLSNLILGIHWFDQDEVTECRVDIDLHLNSPFRHFGWNGNVRDGKDIIYSGDMTSAPKPFGASEAYWITPNDCEPFIVAVNLFTGYKAQFQMFFNSTKNINLDEFHTNNSIYNPNNNLLPPIPMQFTEGNEMTIGMLIDNTFYFYGGRINSGIVPFGHYGNFINGLTNQLNAVLPLNYLLKEVGAKIYNEEEYAKLNESQRAQVTSLAPESLMVNTLTDIIDCQTKV